MTWTLSRAANCVKWTDDMLRELERCAAGDMTVTQTCRRLGLSEETIARGAMLRLRQLVAERGA